MAQKNTRPSEFYAECVRRAFRGKLLLVEAIAGLLALVMVPVGLYFFPNEQGAMNWVPLVIFVAIFVIAVVVGFLAAPYQIFHELEVERNELDQKLDNRERRRVAISKLWELRARGVKHRNKEIAVATVPKWHKEFVAWKTEVYEQAEQVSHGFRAWLEVLDRMRREPGLPPAANKEHLRYRHFMSEMLFRMQEFLQAEMLHRDIHEFQT
jgi:hypothetical protein